MESTTPSHSHGPRTIRAATAGDVEYKWPLAVIGFGLALAVAWTCVLGYGIFKIVALAI